MLRTILKKITEIQAIIQANSDVNSEAEAICRDLVSWKSKMSAPEHMSMQDAIDYTEFLTIVERAEKI